MINVCGVLNTLSYGNVCSGFTYGLIKNGVNAALFPINKYQQYNIYPKYQSYIQEALKNAEFYDCNSPCVRIWHQFEMTEFVGKRRIGFPIFELDKFTEKEKHHLNGCDEVIVCSSWAKQIIEAETKVKAKVVPLGVDTEIFKPIANSEKTRFLYIGKIELRKAVDLVPILFSKAFTKEDDVELLVSFNNPFLSKEEVESWIKYYKNSPLGHKIQFIPYLSSLEDLNILYNSISCGLCISKAEGFDLPLIELMATGRKNIVTNYAGHTQFCSKENSFLVDITELEDAYDPRWFNNGVGQWAHIGKQQEEQIIEYMRLVHKSEKKIYSECVKTAKQHDWTNCAKILMENI